MLEARLEEAVELFHAHFIIYGSNKLHIEITEKIYKTKTFDGQKLFNDGKYVGTKFGRDDRPKYFE